MKKQLISVYKENPHYFAIDDCPVFLVGATHVGGWTPIGKADHDYHRDLERLRKVIEQCEHSQVRGLARVNPAHCSKGHLLPWRKKLDGKYLLDRFSDQWVKRLRDYLRLAHDFGLIVSLEVWDDCSAPCDLVSVDLGCCQYQISPPRSRRFLVTEQ